MTTRAWFRQFIVAGRLLLVLTLLLGLAYPLVITGVAQLIAPDRANGSRATADGRVIGSRLIAQATPGPEWFQPRPSAAGERGYDTLASGASNLGADAPDLIAAVRLRRAEYARANAIPERAVPADAVTASASGLDPEISPANARIQARRVAAARDLPRARVLALVREKTRGRSLGILGEPRVNVLALNLRLRSLR